MNENAKSVICDYCGEEMKLIWTACCSERKGGFFQFQCPKCFACTPRVKTQVDYYKEKPSDKELEEGREAAYDAAMKRDRAKGEWIYKERHEHYPSGKPYTARYCGVCGRRDHNEDSDYCGYCGADMRKEKDEEGV